MYISQTSWKRTLMKLQEFLDRVIASTSFGAYTQLISGKQPIISQHLVQGLIPVWALGVFVFHGLRVVLKLEQENFLVLKFEIDKCQAS